MDLRNRPNAALAADTLFSSISPLGRDSPTKQTRFEPLKAFRAKSFFLV
jgi:hypothetical protein